jgi:hypothetical protein
MGEVEYGEKYTEEILRYVNDNPGSSPLDVALSLEEGLDSHDVFLIMHELGRLEENGAVTEDEESYSLSESFNSYYDIPGEVGEFLEYVE